MILQSKLHTKILGVINKREKKECRKPVQTKQRIGMKGTKKLQRTKQGK